MTSTGNAPQTDELPREQRARWARICAAHAQSLHAGEEASLSTVLKQVPLHERSGLLTQLVTADWKARTAVGKSPSLDDYVTDLPEFKLVIAGCLAALQSGGTPAGDEFAATVLWNSPPDQADGSAAAVPHQIGNYQILAEIARGGMGVVYKARHVSLRRLAAVKLIRAGEFAKEQDVRRFQTEAAAAAKLDHPGIVPVYEIGEHASQHFLAMAYIDGPSLWRLVKESPLEPRHAARLMQQTAEAVQFAHDHGIVHRDLKPQNILIAADGRPRVTDFGLAKFQEFDSSLTETGDVIGTPSYMPPEQAAGRTAEAGPLADVYSLGATLYCLLTGRPPFQAANRLETLLQVVEQEPVSPRQLNPAIARDLETICLKCLQKSPAQRYGAAGELAADLDRFLHGRPITARPVSRLERVGRWCRRNPVLASALGMVLALMVCTIGVLLVSNARIRKSKQTADEATARALDLSGRNAALAEEKGRIADEERIARRLSEWRAAELMFEQAHIRAQQEDDAVGALWFTRALAEAERIEHQPLSDSVRLHLGAWTRSSAFKGLLRDWANAPETWVGANVIAHLEENHAARLTRLDDGSPIGDPMVHQSFIKILVGNPDGTRILTGSNDKTARVWNTQSGKPLCDPLLHAAPVNTAAFSPDGMRFATGTGTTAAVWSRDGYVRSFEVPHPGLRSVVFSPDGERLVTWGGQDVRLWNAATGAALGPPCRHDQPIQHLALSPNGEYFVTALAQTAQFWNGQTGEKLGEPIPLDNRLDELKFSPDSQWLLIEGYPHDQLWNARTRERHPLKLPDIVATAFSPDSQSLLTSANRSGELLLCALESGRTLWRVQHHPQVVLSVAFSPDGQTIAAGDAQGKLLLLNAATGNVLATCPHPRMRISRLRFDDSGRILIAKEAFNWRIWDASAGQQNSRVLKHEHPVISAAMNGDATRVAALARHKELHVWDIHSGDPAHRVVLSLPAQSPERLEHVALSHDGKLAAAAINVLSFPASGRVELWNLETGTQFGKSLPAIAPVSAVSFNSSGTRLLTACQGLNGSQPVKSEVLLWNVADQTPLITPVRHLGRNHARVLSMPLIFSATLGDQGRFVTGGADRAAWVWTVQGAETIGTFLPHENIVAAVALSQDESLVVTGCFDGSVWQWQPDTGKPLHEPLKFPALIRDLAISADGTRLAIGGEDHTVRLWDLVQQKQLGPQLTHGKVVTSVSFSRDGRTLMSGSDDGEVRLWQSPESLAGSIDQIQCWLEVITGRTLTAGGAIQWLDPEAWAARRDLLKSLGGAPRP